MDVTQLPFNRLVGLEGDPGGTASRAATAALSEPRRANRKRDWLVSTLGRALL